MKNKILIILIVLLSILCISSISIVIYQNKNYIKIPKQYKCEGMPKEENQISSKQIIVVNIDKNQYVENYQYKNINTFLDQEQYEFAKSMESTDTTTYVFDDDKKTVLTDYGTSIVQNETGEKVDIWYQEYIKNLETAGFSCKIVK